MRRPWIDLEYEPGIDGDNSRTLGLLFPQKSRFGKFCKTVVLCHSFLEM